MFYPPSLLVGNGSYGEVFLARAAGITEGVEATTVMVKALQNKNEAQQMDFRREMDMLSKLNHDNVVKLLGMCRDAEPQLMITEYLEWVSNKYFPSRLFRLGNEFSMSLSHSNNLVRF